MSPQCHRCADEKQQIWNKDAAHQESEGGTHYPRPPTDPYLTVRTFVQWGDFAVARHLTQSTSSWVCEVSFRPTLAYHRGDILLGANEHKYFKMFAHGKLSGIPHSCRRWSPKVSTLLPDLLKALKLRVGSAILQLFVPGRNSKLDLGVFVRCCVVLSSVRMPT